MPPGRSAALIQRKLKLRPAVAKGRLGSGKMGGESTRAALVSSTSVVKCKDKIGGGESRLESRGDVYSVTETVPRRSFMHACVAAGRTN